MRALHAEGRKAGLTHADLSEIARRDRGVGLADLSDADLRAWSKRLRGATARIVDRQAGRSAAAAGRRDHVETVSEIVSGKTLELLGGYAEALGWTRETLDRFIERQLGGRRKIRTTADANKVIWPLKRIWRERNRSAKIAHAKCD